MSLIELKNYFKRQVEPDEWPVLIWSFLYFVFLLTGYFILRPIREEMGVTAGPENFKYLFTATFVVMLLLQPLYGWVVSRYERKQFIPIVYGFFAVLILLMWSLFQWMGHDNVVVARVFFVFVSIYNLFIVSIFWSFMADIYTQGQGKRLFGIIAAGGSLGGIIGGLITSQLVFVFGTINLLLVSLGFLLLCLICVLKIRIHATDSDINREAKLGGSPLEGMKLLFGSGFLQQIAIMSVLAVVIGGIFYTLQAEYVKQFFPDRDQRTAVFAYVNMATNGLTLVYQFLLVPFLLQRFKIHQILGIYPTMMILALLLFGLMPVLYVVLAAITLQRSGAYGLMKPPTDWLFTGLPDNIKYKFKNFLDTVVYRAGDVFTQFVVVDPIRSSGMDLRLLALVGAILSGFWLYNAIQVGRQAARTFQARQADLIHLSD